MDQAGWLAAGQRDHYLFECPRAEVIYHRAEFAPLDEVFCRSILLQSTRSYG
jgi:hypothetical protein